MNPELDITAATRRVEPAHKLRCAEPRSGWRRHQSPRAVHALGGEAATISSARGAASEMIINWGFAYKPFGVVAISGVRQSLKFRPEPGTSKQTRGMER